MTPAKCQRYRRIITRRTGELLVGIVAIALHDPAVAAEQSIGMAFGAACGILINHRRRIGTAA